MLYLLDFERHWFVYCRHNSHLANYIKAWFRKCQCQWWIVFCCNGIMSECKIICPESVKINPVIEYYFSPFLHQFFKETSDCFFEHNICISKHTSCIGEGYIIYFIQMALVIPCSHRNIEDQLFVYISNFTIFSISITTRTC